jgi:DNA-directed RNA polymerase specialized sigma24 family protein
MILHPFQSLLDLHSHEIHGFLASRVGGVDADDCYQETWIAALRAYPRLREDSNLRAWLLTIAHRKAIDCVRARGRSVPTDPMPELGVVEAADPPDGGPLAAVGGLPQKQREAVTLRFVLDADYARIAEVMGVTEAAARQNVAAGLRKLREEHGDEWTAA